MTDLAKQAEELRTIAERADKEADHHREQAVRHEEQSRLSKQAFEQTLKTLRDVARP